MAEVFTVTVWIPLASVATYSLALEFADPAAGASALAWPGTLPCRPHAPVIVKNKKQNAKTARFILFACCNCDVFTRNIEDCFEQSDCSKKPRKPPDKPFVFVS